MQKKIKSMIDEKWQVRTKDGFRDVRETDFAILMNSVKSNSPAFIKALKDKGLNAYSQNDEFFEQTEIMLILSFVRAITNPLKDIPLVSVMRSPVYRFTDDELAEIRLCGYGEFWNAVKKKAIISDSLGAKCKDFVSDINKWRELSNFMTADRLVWRIMTDCSLYDMCAILYGGESALANMRLFVERTRELSNIGISTLYDLEQYMTNIAENGGLQGANISVEGIPIMTIHKSKGLEFPVVFVCGMGKKFLFDGNSGAVTLHNRLGFGLNNINSELSYSIPTINRKIIAAEKNRENLSEQLRKLYVALTRAKEKLIVTGVVNSTKNKGAFEFADDVVNETNIQKASSFISIIAPAIKQYGGADWIYNEVGYNFDNQEVQPQIETNIEEVDAEDAKKQIYEAFEKFSSVKTIPATPTKVSVSQLKNRTGIAKSLQKFPAFMIKNEGNGAAFGTLVHNVMENIVLTSDMNSSYICSEIVRITGEANESVLNMTKTFFDSELGRRILNSQEVQREADFEIEIPAFDKNENPVNGELMLLQGVVDLFFEENGNYILVDYKTDKCNSLSELVDKYLIQLKWYKHALEKLLNKKVAEIYIYSFHKNSYIELSEMLENE